MMVPPPGFISTTTGCPHCSDMCWPTSRASRSAEPPAASGTTKRMGLTGKSCAQAIEGRKAPAAAAPAKVRNVRRWVMVSGWLKDGEVQGLKLDVAIRHEAVGQAFRLGRTGRAGHHVANAVGVLERRPDRIAGLLEDFHATDALVGP